MDERQEGPWERKKKVIQAAEERGIPWAETAVKARAYLE